jgi:hypothetical protein
MRLPESRRDNVCFGCVWMVCMETTLVLPARLEGWLADNGCLAGLLPLLGNSPTVFNGDLSSLRTLRTYIHTPAIMA